MLSKQLDPTVLTDTAERVPLNHRDETTFQVEDAATRITAVWPT
jgi:hypothetical protein